MSRIFRLGDFFGITATQLVLFKPKRFEDLLNSRYTSQASESLYALQIELNFLKDVLATDAMKPDYEKLVEDFKLLGYLSLTSESTNNKAKMAIAKFYKDSETKPIEELRSIYGGNTDEMLNIIKDSLTIDVATAFPNISATGVAIVNVIFKNYDYLKEITKKCKEAYNNSSIHEAQIGGRSIREIIELDNDGTTSSYRCCSFAHQLMTRVRMAKNPVECVYALKELEHDIENIEMEYEAKNIEFTPIQEIVEILEDVYSDMTYERFLEITGLNVDSKDVEEALKQLDSYGIGGIGFNSREMGKELISSVSHEDTTGWTVKSKEHNEKLDNVLRLAYINLKSQQYMMEV